MVTFKLWNWMGLNPQKFSLKFICHVIYLTGFGDCWYEKKQRCPFSRRTYFMWSVFVNMYIIVVILDECLLFTIELNGKERNDLIQKIVTQSMVYLKAIVFMIQRNKIKVVLKKLLEEYREVYASINIDRASVRKASILITIMTISIQLSLASVVYSRIKYEMREGLPIQVTLTYYPNPDSTGKYDPVFRLLTDFHWYYITIIKFGLDGIYYCSLVFIEYKFKTLQEYFQNIKMYVFNHSKRISENEIEEEIKRRVIAGIQLHQSALWCATNIQSVLGNIYGIQVIESIGLLVNSLLKIVTDEHDMTLISNLICMCTLIYLTGSYMIPAGDLTWEANEVSTAMYDCGWELSTGKLNRELRTLLTVAIQCSQVPIYMTAFGVVALSYANFISVLRSSYSFFAVMY